MTPEQLDEIEKRWAGYLEKDEGERRFLFDRWWDKRDFWDMTKALREAWEALDQVSSDYRMSEAQIIAAITKIQKERDEARAEVERLKQLAREAIDFAVVLSGAAPDEYYWEYDAQLKALEAKKP